MQREPAAGPEDAARLGERPAPGRAAADHAQGAEHGEGVGERPVGEAAEAAEVRRGPGRLPRPPLGLATDLVRASPARARPRRPGTLAGEARACRPAPQPRSTRARLGEPGVEPRPRRPRTGDGRGSRRPPPRPAGACGCIPRARRSPPRAAARRGGCGRCSSRRRLSTRRRVPSAGRSSRPRIIPASTPHRSCVQTSSSRAPPARWPVRRRSTRRVAGPALSAMTNVSSPSCRRKANTSSCGVQERERAAAQRGMGFRSAISRWNSWSRRGPRSSVLCQGNAAAVGRVVAAGHADLVAVVDRRGAGVGHLEERRQPQGRLVAPGQREEPGHVVAVEQVQLHGGDVRVIEAEQPLDRLRGTPRRRSGRASGSSSWPSSSRSTASPMKKAMQARVNR